MSNLTRLMVQVRRPDGTSTSVEAAELVTMTRPTGEVLEVRADTMLKLDGVVNRRFILVQSLVNQEMQRKIESGDCVPIEWLGATKIAAAGDEIKETVGTFRLPHDMPPGVDLCVLSDEMWIWSVGRRQDNAQVYAATDARFYQANGWECLFLR